MVVLIKAAAPTSHALASMALIDFQKTVAKAYRDLLRAQQHAFSGDFRVLAGKNMLLPKQALHLARHSR